MKSLRLIVLCVLVSYQAVWAQKRSLSDDPVIFGKQVSELLNSTRQPEAMALGNNFDSLWSAGIYSPEEQKLIMESAIHLEKRRMRLTSHFVPYISMLIQADQVEQLSSEQMVTMLNLTQRVVKEYDPKGLQDYLATLDGFFSRKAVFSSAYFALQITEGSYTFDFVEESEGTFEEPQKSSETEEEGYFDDWDSEDTSSSGDDWGSSDWGSSGWGDETEENQQDKPQTTSDVLAILPDVVLPQVKGAVIRFTGVNLEFQTPYDTAGMTQVTGALVIKNHTFVAGSGRFDWSSAGLSADTVYCDFPQGFSFDIHTPAVSAERVLLTYKGKISEQVEGVFEYKSKRRNKDQAPQYPRFKSYDSNVKIENIGAKNLIYHGGFSLHGAKINSSSLGSEVSSLKLMGEGRKKFIARSRQFYMGDTTITGKQTAMVIYQGEKDSIFHPAVQFSYDKINKQLLLLKDEGGYKHSPYTATYYDMEITADMLAWDIEKDSLSIMVLNARSQVPATFTSMEYYDQVQFNRLSGVYDFHPLLMVVSYARKQGVKEFYLEDMVKAYNQNLNTVQGAVIDLMQQGYVDYSKITGRVKVKRKGMHYVLSNYKKKDYDDLLIPSIDPDGANATLDFNTNELTVRGIEKFYLSERLRVYIRPDSQQITLLNNRDFRFNGRVFSGNLEYQGKDFFFDYDKFLLDLNQIDTIRFHVNSKKTDRRGNSVSESLENEMVQTSGTLYIDRPDNKSSVKDFPQYPRFTATKGGRVYFDKTEILDAAYDKTVYFDIPPFELDSMSDAGGKGISFNGTMVTGGIFPPFQEKLVIMPDKSLGFLEHKIPDEGYALYQGSGTVYNALTLDGEGLKVNGKIEYLTTSLESENFTFYMDSVVAEGAYAFIEEGILDNTSFPQAYVENYKMKWQPYKDSLNVTNIKDPFKFYSETATMEGTAVITKNGVHGTGILRTRGSESVSDSLTFEQTMYSARHAKFEIKSDNPQKPALKGDDIALTFNLAENFAEISPEVQGIAAIDFPYAQMKTSISKASWNLEDKTVRMSKPEDVDINKTYFYSTRKELDSLAFNAEEAIYDINQLKLNIYGIPFIKVADAKVIPENNEVLILENSELQQFTNATLLIDTLNAYHTLTEGNIKVFSRKKFEGSAIYQFVNAVEDSFSIEIKKFDLQPVQNRWGRTKGFRTVSSAQIKEEDELAISPGMIFKGKVTMYAEKKPLELEGSVKLDFKKRKDYNSWITHKSDSAENQEVVIDFNTARMADGSSLIAGLYIDEAKKLYTSFIEPTRGVGDELFFKPSGKLYYEVDNQRYVIEENPEKAEGKSYAGKMYTYHEESGKVTFEGAVDFIHEPEVSILAAGKGEGNVNSEEYQMNALMAFNFDLPSRAHELMAQDFLGVIERLGAEPASPDLTSLLYKLAGVKDHATAKEFETLSLEDYATLPMVSSELGDRLVISNLDLKWSAEHQAWYSTSKIGLANINDFEVNASFDGFVEIKKHLEGDRINLFIQASPGSWYYISYENNRTYLFASNEKFNQLIRDKSKAHKAKPGQYVFAPSDLMEANAFINRFRLAYFGIDAPYQLEMPIEEVVDSYEEANDDQETYETIQPVNYTEEDQAPEEKEEEEDEDGF